jgi:hypothetical protein
MGTHIADGLNMEVITMHGTVMMFLFAVPIGEVFAMLLCRPWSARATCRSRGGRRLEVGKAMGGRLGEQIEGAQRSGSDAPVAAVSARRLGCA